MNGGPRPDVSIVVPVFNEQHTICEVVQQLLAVPLATEIIVVDDGSTDGTASAIEVLRDRIVYERLPCNRGKGAALRTGFALAQGRVIVVQDADLELSPALVSDLVGPIIDRSADVVYGSRFIGGAPGVRWSRRLANRLLTGCCNLLFGTRLTDMETAHKAFRADLLPHLHLVSERFEIEVEITAKLARLGARFQEISSPYRPRNKDEGKKIRLRDGLLALRALASFHSWHPDRGHWRASDP